MCAIERRVDLRPRRERSSTLSAGWSSFIAGGELVLPRERIVRLKHDDVKIMPAGH